MKRSRTQKTVVIDGTPNVTSIKSYVSQSPSYLMHPTEGKEYTIDMFDKVNTLSVQDIQNRIKALTDGTE